tara:strand:+ start:247 stop:609 length:363 start_codon:yes stop_codon:yes gene_type:complete
MSSKRISNREVMDKLDLVMSLLNDSQSKPSIKQSKTTSTVSKDMVMKLVEAGCEEIQLRPSMVNASNSVIGFVPKAQWNVLKEIVKATGGFTYPKLGFKGNVPEAFTQSLSNAGISVIKH